MHWDQTRFGNNALRVPEDTSSSFMVTLLTGLEHGGLMVIAFACVNKRAICKVFTKREFHETATHTSFDVIRQQS